MVKGQLGILSILFGSWIGDAQVGWQQKVKQELPSMGHRNWILIVNSAYRFQTSPGIETIETISEDEAAGVDDYRRALNGRLAGIPADSPPHGELISKLEGTGKTFLILALKTSITIPYTSLLIELDCKYWSADSEARLLEAIRNRN
jgi:hypothetical protein